jgi:hypothetical protein
MAIHQVSDLLAGIPAQGGKGADPTWRIHRPDRRAADVVAVKPTEENFFSEPCIMVNHSLLMARFLQQVIRDGRLVG